MKTLDRIIFVVIAVFLGILAVRSLTVKPVAATEEEIIKVNLVEIGGQRVWRDQLINPQDSGGLTPQEFIENWQRAKEKR